MTPMQQAKKQREKALFVTGIIALIIASILITVAILNHKDTQADQTDEPTSLNDTLQIGKPDDVKNILGQELFTTMTSTDTRVYAVGSTTGSIVISRAGTNINQADVEGIIKTKVGTTDSLSQYAFPDDTVFSQQMGYQCIIAGQKMIIGYYLNSDGYLYSISYSVSEAEFTEQFPKVLEVIRTISFKPTA